MKRCSFCGVEKPLTEFYKGTGRFGKQSRCKQCVNQRLREDQQLYNRRNRLKRHYGLTLADYETLLRAQNGRCRICGTTMPGGNSQHFKVDHDHKTGKVRGLLCNDCNLGIGKFRDDHELVVKAAEYLKSHLGT